MQVKHFIIITSKQLQHNQRYYYYCCCYYYYCHHQQQEQQQVSQLVGALSPVNHKRLYQGCNNNNNYHYYYHHHHQQQQQQQQHQDFSQNFKQNFRRNFGSSAVDNSTVCDHTAPVERFCKTCFLLLDFQWAGSKYWIMRCWVLLLHRSRGGGRGERGGIDPCLEEPLLLSKKLEIQKKAKPRFYPGNVMKSSWSGSPTCSAPNDNKFQTKDSLRRETWLLLLPQQDHKVLIHLFFLGI